MEFNTLMLDGANSLIHNNYFYGFVAIIVFDYITGICKGMWWKVADSSVGFKGLIKHCLLLVAVALVWLFADTYNATPLAFAITGMFAANYGISILENFAVMGIYVPPFLLAKVQAEKKRYEQKIEEALNLKLEEEEKAQNGKSSTG